MEGTARRGHRRARGAPLIADPDFSLYLGDALDILPSLDAGSVDAVVTSPPYGDQRKQAPMDGYVEWLSPFLDELLRVVKPSGSLMLNLGRIFRNGEEVPYHEEAMLAARRLGWFRIDTIIWHKLNAHPFGAPQYLLNRHELVYWLGRTVDSYRGYTDETRTAPASTTVERRGRAGLRGPKNRARNNYVPAARTNVNPDGVRPSSVFGCNVGREKGLEHDSPMALELASHLVALSCPPGGLVLDPFAGAGTTALAARQSGRRSIGIEVDPAAAEECARRLAQQSLLSEA